MRHFILICWLLVVGTSLPAQSGSNPFELTERLAAARQTTARDTSPNPFDLYPSDGPAKATTPAAAAARPEIASPGEVDTEPVVFVHLLLVVMVTSLWVLFRNLLKQCLTATLNDNMMTQLFRRRSGGQISALWLCYLFFLLSAGFYLYLLATALDVPLPGGVWTGWFITSLIVAAVVGLKFFVLLLLGRIFPLRKELSRYTFVLMVFSILTGVILVPINLLVSYAPPDYGYYFLIAGAAVLALIYLVHLVRGLFIANHYVGSRPLHFLLYICTIEIAPLLLVYRYLTSVLI
ncbi:DUF4271 domain-containing protein [Neolewinella litorea]|uniref:DUF4271 domain-containing protein n=1 Tax=Neolewinella litorea TaxID=2562452 RepID=A0A4S4NI29_9BACT|nr:DUF4271 domain-containing protein [Neolewinella litorea]THH37861.1 DUF4271 domain-containing protein [Neolewinella litorea]